MKAFTVLILSLASFGALSQTVNYVDSAGHVYRVKTTTDKVDYFSEKWEVLRELTEIEMNIKAWQEEIDRAKSCIARDSSAYKSLKQIAINRKYLKP